MKKKTQYSRILKSLKKGTKITPLDALRWFGCLRLGAHIYAMRQNGLKVKTTLVDLGNGKHVARYSLGR